MEMEVGHLVFMYLILCILTQLWGLLWLPTLPPQLFSGKQSISLEPAGQFELSGAPLETLHQTYAEANSHLYQSLQMHNLGYKHQQNNLKSYFWGQELVKGFHV